MCLLIRRPCCVCFYLSKSLRLHSHRFYLINWVLRTLNEKRFVSTKNSFFQPPPTKDICIPSSITKIQKLSRFSPPDIEKFVNILRLHGSDTGLTAWSTKNENFKISPRPHKNSLFLQYPLKNSKSEVSQVEYRKNKNFKWQSTCKKREI